MITKNDCLLLLSDIREKGTDCSKEIKTLMGLSEPSLEIIKFINDNRQLDLTKFYEKIRKSYNDKRSNLYINIVKEIEDTNEVLTTLSALLTQILIFAKKSDNRNMFLKHARCDEISRVLTRYFQTYDLISCIQLLRLIKCDLVALETVSGRRK